MEGGGIGEDDFILLFFFFFFFAASILYVFICLVGEDDINRGKVSMKGFEI